MTELFITRGLPASGKTTWAMKWVAEVPQLRARVNRDEMRMNLYGKYTGLVYAQEEQVSKAQQAAVRALLQAGTSVVVDDTNLRQKHALAWRALAQECGATFRLMEIWTPVDECIERDKVRARDVTWGRSVGAEVIRSFHDRYFGKGGAPKALPPVDAPPVQYHADPMLPTAWLVDVDGTLARHTNRGPFDWGRVGEDEPHADIISLVRDLKRTNQIVILSGRDGVCYRETENWLYDHGVEYDALFMREAGDTRKDAIIKAEIFWAGIAWRWNVQGVLDDRDRVVAMWRAMGVRCLQVASGNF